MHRNPLVRMRLVSRGMLLLLFAACGADDNVDTPQEPAVEAPRWAHAQYTIVEGELAPGNDAIPRSFDGRLATFTQTDEGDLVVAFRDAEDGASVLVVFAFRESPQHGDTYSFSKGYGASVELSIIPDAECEWICNGYQGFGGTAHVTATTETVRITYRDVTLNYRELFPDSETDYQSTVQGVVEWTRACETGGACDGEQP